MKTLVTTEVIMNSGFRPNMNRLHHISKVIEKYQMSKLDTIRCYKVSARYYCQSDNSQMTWLLHSQDTLPVFDFCLVNYDTGLLEHVVITHCDSDGIIPCERQVDSIILSDNLMPIRLVCCHPAKAHVNYPYWPIMGNWLGETYVTLKNGILYVCSELDN